MPVDLMAVARAGMSLVPDIRAQMMQDDERRAMNEQRAVLNEQRRVATEAAQEKQMRLRDLRSGLNAAVLSGKPQAITRLMTQFPEYADQIKPGWQALRSEERQANQTQVGSAYVRGQNGDYKGAAAILQKRYDADLAAESHDAQTKQIIDDLNSDDPQRQRIAVSTLGIYLASDDPEKFAQLYPDLEREARLHEIQPYEVARKQAEAQAAPGYYGARADKERHQATTAASNARYADAKNAAVIDRAGATAANARSLADRRNAGPATQTGSAPASAPAPQRRSRQSAKEIVATDGRGNRIRYNPEARQWEPF